MKKYQELLKLARECIDCELNGKKLEVSEEIKKKYSKKQACFVTLTIDGELRGCIGSLEAHQELWRDVINNARHAAFDDYRFEPLNEDELNKIKIEISVLGESKKLEYKDSLDLLKKIDNKMGIILKKGWSTATFLPQVWRQIPDKIKFLEQLSLKAGLSKDDWKNADYEYYRVESIEED